MDESQWALGISMILLFHTELIFSVHLEDKDITVVRHYVRYREPHLIIQKPSSDPRANKEHVLQKDQATSMNGQTFQRHLFSLLRKFPANTRQIWRGKRNIPATENFKNIEISIARTKRSPRNKMRAQVNAFERLLRRVRRRHRDNRTSKQKRKRRRRHKQIRCRDDLCTEDRNVKGQQEKVQVTCPEKDNVLVLRDGKYFCENATVNESTISPFKIENSHTFNTDQRFLITPTFETSTQTVFTHTPKTCSNRQFYDPISKRCVNYVSDDDVIRFSTEITTERPATATEPLKCPPNHVVMSRDGDSFCVNVPNLTTPMTTICPKGRKPGVANGQLICQDDVIIITPAPPIESTTMCPDGLRPFLSPVGVTCTYVSANKKLRDLPQVNELPSEQDVFAKGCHGNQKMISTTSGPVCSDEPSTVDSPLATCDPFCLNEEPCPLGQLRRRVGDEVVCAYPERHQKQDGDGDIYIFSSCPPGGVLTQTKTSFVCQPTTVDVGSLQCPERQLIVQLTHEIVCMPEEHTAVVCPWDQQLVPGTSSYICIDPNAVMVPTLETIQCSDSEIPIIDGDHVTCGVQSMASPCRPGYRGVLSGNSLLCKAIRMIPECPAGYVMAYSSRGLMECHHVTGSRPEVQPCEASYHLHEEQGSSVCILIGECPVDYHHGDKNVGCGRSLTSLMLTCIPQCANGGTCQDGVCNCLSGFTGAACEIDVDECQLENHFCQYHCQNAIGSYHCACPPGHVLNEDRATCTDTTCFPRCLNGGRCHRGQCVCLAGFTGRLCELDVDECESRPGTCQFRCWNTLGSFRCLCPRGFVLNSDQRTCQNRWADGHCRLRCLHGGRCDGPYHCACPPRYTGRICQAVLF